MATVKEIEDAVQSLSAEELAAFRDWFLAFEAEKWDRQIEADATSGRLDAFADEALQDLDANRCTDR